MRVISYVILIITVMMSSIASAQNCDLFYTTKPGDTLSSIAYQFYGDRQEWRTIKEANSDNVSIKASAMPIDLLLYIPCVNDAINSQSLIVENIAEEPLLDQLLGDGIINNSNAKNSIKSKQNSSNNTAIENSSKLSPESASELEELLGGEIATKKSKLDEDLEKIKALLEKGPAALDDGVTQVKEEATPAQADSNLGQSNDSSKRKVETVNTEDKQVELTDSTDSEDEISVVDDVDRNENETGAVVKEEDVDAEPVAVDEADHQEPQSDSNIGTEVEAIAEEKQDDSSMQSVEANDEQVGMAEDADKSESGEQTSTVEDMDLSENQQDVVSEENHTEIEQDIQAVDDKQIKTDSSTQVSELTQSSDTDTMTSVETQDDPSAVDAENNEEGQNVVVEVENTDDEQVSVDVQGEPETQEIVNNEVSEPEFEAEDIEQQSQESDAVETSTEEILTNASANPGQNDTPSSVTDITAVQIEQLKNDLSAIQEQAKLEIEAMKSRMEELEQELEEAQIPDTDSTVENMDIDQLNQLEFPGSIEENVMIEENAQDQDILVEQTDIDEEQIQIASIEQFEVNDLGKDPGNSEASANESLMSILRLRLIDTITLLKAELSAADDSDTSEMEKIRAEIEKLESTFEEIESIAAEELETEKSKVEQLEAKINNIESSTASSQIGNNENNSVQSGNENTQKKASASDSCKTFPNLCKYLESK